LTESSFAQLRPIGMKFYVSTPFSYNGRKVSMNKYQDHSEYYVRGLLLDLSGFSLQTLYPNDTRGSQSGAKSAG
jgi:hypothetical protein